MVLVAIAIADDESVKVSMLMLLPQLPRLIRSVAAKLRILKIDML